MTQPTVLCLGVLLATGCTRNEHLSATLKGHTEEIHCLAFSPDGTTLATAGGIRGKGGEVFLWDVSTGKQKASLKGLGSVVVAVAFSPDGKTLATRTLLFNETVKLWDVTSGDLRASLKREGCVLAMAFSADSKVIATGGLGSGGSVTFWDVATGKQEDSFHAHEEQVSRIVFSSDGNTLATGGGALPCAVNLWDLTTKKSRIRLGHDGSIQALTFSPDCKLLASASLGPTATLWDAGSGEEKTRLKHGSFDPSKDPPMVSVESVIFSPDGNLVATVASDQTVKVWEVKSGKEVISVKGYVLVFSPKGRTAATAAIGDPVKLWDLGTGKERMSLPAGLVTDIAISPDGRTLATGTDDKSVRLWSIGETLK